MSLRHISYSVIGSVLATMGVLGLLASFALTYDTLQIAANADYEPACSINPIISCTSVMETSQATTLGSIPNSMFGIIGFSMLIVFGIIVATGVILPRKIWQIAQLAATVGVLFAHYLMLTSVFVLHTICPWCFLTWLVTIAIFWAVTTYNAQHGLILRGDNFINFRHMWQRNSIAILVLWYGFLFALLLVEFWDYWQTLL